MINDTDNGNINKIKLFLTMKNTKNIFLIKIYYILAIKVAAILLDEWIIVEIRYFFEIKRYSDTI